MYAKTMEGLVGASTNMKLLNTPFRVYKDAERRGDTAVMERAMGYVGDFAENAKDYQKKAEEGMKEEAKEAREKAKAEQEKRIAESQNEETDTVSISEGGKAAWDEKMDSVQTGADNGGSIKETADAVKTEPVIYLKTGEASKPESGTNLSALI